MEISMGSNVGGIKLRHTDGGDTFYYQGELYVASDLAKEKYGDMNVLCLRLSDGFVKWIDEDKVIEVMTTKVERV